MSMKSALQEMEQQDAGPALARNRHELSTIEPTPIESPARYSDRPGIDSGSPHRSAIIGSRRLASTSAVLTPAWAIATARLRAI